MPALHQTQNTHKIQFENIFLQSFVLLMKMMKGQLNHPDFSVVLIVLLLQPLAAVHASNNDKNHAYNYADTSAILEDVVAYLIFYYSTVDAIQKHEKAYEQTNRKAEDTI